MHIEAAARNARYVLVTEPKRNGGKVVTSRKGTGRFQIEAHGRPSHAGVKHEKGRSAIRAIARTILEIEGFTDYERGITTNVGIVSGGTGVNVVPEHARINADVRVVDLERGGRDGSPFPRAIVAGAGRDVDGDRRHDPAALCPATRQCRFAVRQGAGRGARDRHGAGDRAAHRRRLGRQFHGGLGVPTLDGLGVDGEGAHTLQEHMLVSSIGPGVRLFQGLFATLA